MIPMNRMSSTMTSGRLRRSSAVQVARMAGAGGRQGDLDGMGTRVAHLRRLGIGERRLTTRCRTCSLWFTEARRFRVALVGQDLAVRHLARGADALAHDSTEARARR
jgi:hypothetical protein